MFSIELKLNLTSKDIKNLQAKNLSNKIDMHFDYIILFNVEASLIIQETDNKQVVVHDGTMSILDHMMF